MTNTSKYWEERYVEDNTPWDIGTASPALINYCKKHVAKELKILIPGAGKSHELGQLWALGYKNVYVCDWSQSAIETAKILFSGIPSKQFIVSDFFEISNDYDVILEQTFFCALPINLREQYVQKCSQLLAKNSGVLAGLLFDVIFEKEGPPFGGCKSDYENLFSKYFKFLTLKSAEDSIEPRMGNELFIEARVG